MQMNKQSRRRSIAADVILVVMFLLITLLYALLMFTDRLPLFGIAFVGLLWLSFWLLTGRISFATPMDLPIIGLITLLPLSLAITVDRELVIPNLYSLGLAIPLFYVIVNAINQPRRVQLAGLAIIFLAIATSTPGLLGTDWENTKLPLLTPIYENLPNLVSIIPGAPAGGGINANTLGGALAFFPPLLLSLIWDKGGFKRMFQKDKGQLNPSYFLYKVLLLFTLLFTSAALILTQSRAAYLGTVIGIIVLAVWKDHRFLWSIPLIIVIIGITWQFYAQGSTLGELITLLDSSGERTLESRLELWQNTISVIQDFPLTGVGLNTFGSILSNYYSFNIFPYGDEFYFHAHNTFLTIAVEMGIPALALYSTLIGSFTAMAVRIYKKGRTFIQALTMGLFCGLLAHMAYGMMDAYTLGKILGVIMWIFYGVMAALYIHRRRMIRNHHQNSFNQSESQQPNLDQVKRRFLDLITGLGEGA